MKKLILSSLMAGALALSANAQSDFNKWSLEVNGGFNKPMAPITPGYYSPTLNLGHADLGVRYMFNEKFGAKLDYGFGSFQNAEDTPSFSTKYYRLNLQGVANLGRMMNFETFSNSFGLLLHMGGGIGNVNPEENTFNDFTDKVYNIIFGLTPQVKVTNKIAIVGDFTTVLNGRQSVAFDGASVKNPSYGANGTWFTGTLGVQFYLGSSDIHADWYVSSNNYATKEELASQINGIKDMLKDSDGDGVPDYLDKEPNTPAGARVNASGMTMDSDGDGTPDHLDKCPFLAGPSSTSGCPAAGETSAQMEVDSFREAINEGYVNVYFSFDSSNSLSYSVPAVNYAANFMKRNPGVKLEVKGYADELGEENYNIQLSEKRAKAVYDVLVASGVDASRLTYKGYGEDTSVDKSSADARQLARRVSFDVK